MNENIAAKFTFANYDESILADLPVEDQQAIRQTVLVQARTLIDVGYQGEDIAFDDSTVSALEKVLADFPEMRFGRRTYDIERMKNQKTGNWTSSAKHIAAMQHLVDGIGIMFGYCIAKCIGGKLALDEEGALVVVHPTYTNATSYPLGKVYKFLRNGEEDSLVGFLAAVKAKPFTDQAAQQLVQALRDQCEEDGIELPDDMRVQVWTHKNPAGEIELSHVTFADGDGEAIVSAKWGNHCAECANTLH